MSILNDTKCSRCGNSGLHACMGTPFNMLPEEEQTRLRSLGFIPVSGDATSSTATLVRMVREDEGRQ